MSTSLIDNIQNFRSSYNWNVEFPSYISNNLKHSLRYYQKEAIDSFLAFLSINDEEIYNNLHVYTDVNQLLFRMATGSGKTDIMAGTILALYKEKNIQRFLFTTSLNSVLDKTINNLLDTSSSKYLFNNIITIAGAIIRIVKIDKNEDFPNPEPNTIYIKVASIQLLITQLDTNRMQEGRSSLDNFIESPLGLLIDEAHHFNKNATTTIKVDNSENRSSFEETIDRIRNAVIANGNYSIQLEFTATMPFGTSGRLGNLKDKYINKLIYDYSLTKFVEEDGYGKSLSQIESSSSNEEKMLIGILLNQYRKELSLQAGFKNFKPIILFKSHTIKSSREMEHAFISAVNNLTAERLEQLFQKHPNSESDAIKSMLNHFDSFAYEVIINKLKDEFLNTTLNANPKNSSNKSEEERILKNLNSLEDLDNPFRVIFAVEKVSEGWDVLNLYDIVRLNERGNRSNTNAEAQLVGRGARYYPLQHADITFEKQSFNFEKIYEDSNDFPEDMFSDEVKNKLYLLETLHYHTVQDPDYLEELRKSYSLLGIPVTIDGEVDTFHVTMKQSFKGSYFYNNGYFVENTKEYPSREDYYNLSSYGFKNGFSVHVSTGLHESKVFKAGTISAPEWETITRRIHRSYIVEAMENIDFYRFNTMKEYMPLLESKRQFIDGTNWLEIWNKEINFHILRGEELSTDLILMGAIEVMAKIADLIQRNFMKPKGTKIFNKISAKNRLPENYSRSFKRRIGIRYGSISTERYNSAPYNIIPGNSLERKLVRYINNVIIPEMNNSGLYSNIYLIRNDEVKNGIKIHEFDGVRTFYPDFILYLENSQQDDFEVTQIYIEPKGEHLVAGDQWKEDLLLSLGADSDITFHVDNDDFHLLGVKFLIGNINGDFQNLETFDPDLRSKSGLPEWEFDLE